MSGSIGSPSEDRPGLPVLSGRRNYRPGSADVRFDRHAASDASLMLNAGGVLLLVCSLSKKT
jgi:hypothetical protein